MNLNFSDPNWRVKIEGVCHHEVITTENSQNVFLFQLREDGEGALPVHG